jgi:hypothetical protein
MAPAARPPTTPAATAPPRTRASASLVTATIEPAIVTAATSAIIHFLMNILLLGYGWGTSRIRSPWLQPSYKTLAVIEFHGILSQI